LGVITLPLQGGARRVRLR